MRFIEIAMSRNAGHSGLPDNVLINLDGILEVFVRALLPRETDTRGYEYGLFIVHQSRQIRLHGTKSECEQGYEELRALLDWEDEIVQTFKFPSADTED